MELLSSVVSEACELYATYTAVVVLEELYTSTAVQVLYVLRSSIFKAVRITAESREVRAVVY